MSEKNTQAHDSGSEALTETSEAPAVPEVAGTPVRPELRLEVIAAPTGQFGASDAGDTTGYGEHRSVVTLAPAAAIEKVVIEHDELTLFIAREHLLDVVRPLRDDQDLRFELCLGVSGVHYPHLAGRELHACIELMSLTHGGRQLRLQVACPETDPHVPSIVSVYPGNDWHERETWDLMGIVFDGHPHLTRTAMPDDWVGHPQRKDYPLGGIPVEYKGAQTPPADTRRSYR